MSVAAAPLRPFDPRLLARARVVRAAFGLDVAAGVTATLALMAQITLLATALAAVARGRPGAVTPALLAGIALSVVVRAGCAWGTEWTGRRAATQVMSGLRRELVAARLRPGRGVGDPGGSVGVAEVATAAVQGVDGLEVYFARYLPQVVLAVVVPAAVLVWSFVLDPTSAAIMAVTLPVVPLFMVLIGKAAAAKAEANFAALAALAAHFLDVVRGLPTLRAFNRGAAQVPRIAESTEQYRRTTMATLRLSFLSGFVLDLATTLATALVAVTLGVRLVGGSLALRPALCVLLLVPELYAPIRSVASLFHASTDGLAAAGLLIAAADAVAADGEPSAPTDVAGVVRSAAALPDPAVVPVALHAVRVEYPDRAVPALDAVSLAIAPGSVVAVLGPSGAGKTTLARVVLGLRRPDAGCVALGETPLTPADADAWRTHLAWAPQDPVIVHASVAANVALGRPDMPPATIGAALAAVGLDATVADLPEGTATVVGVGGRGLSAGQRRRLGLARAVARGAGLIVVDEPTAHLDPASAAQVRDAVVALGGTATVLVLTHDDALAARCDRRVRLEAGRVVADSGPVPLPEPAAGVR